MKLGKRRIILVKIFIILFLILLTTTFTISYLYSTSLINKDLYFKLLLNDSYGNNFYITLVEYISNKINPLRFIEIENNKLNIENRINISPIIYIYNTNQNSNYQKEYNTKSSILLSTYYLSEKLNNNGISTIYEDNNINNFSINNNINIQDSINILKKEKISNYNINYIIELGMKKYSDIIKKDNNYAIIYLYANDSNFKFINKLNKSLNSKIKDISKIYYDNNSYNIIKIDIGGSNNYMNEVLRTIDILSSSLSEVINE